MGARATIDALETLKFEVLSHPPYSPDLAPSDFRFFPHLKRDLRGTHELIKHDCRITQKQIAGRLGMSKERVGHIIGLLGYTKVCSRWVPRRKRRNDWCSGDAEVWGSLPSALQPWLGAKRFPFLSSPQEGSQGDSFHIRWWSEASCDVVDQTKNSWILHWRHA